MAKKPSKKTLQNKLWQLLKTYVRMRDNNRCQKCRRHVEGRQADTSHVIARGQNGRLKYDPLNLKVLCMGCHRWWHDCPPESGMWFREYFPDRWRYLQSMRNYHGTMHASWYEDQIEYVKGLIEDIDDDEKSKRA